MINTIKYSYNNYYTKIIPNEQNEIKIKYLNSFTNEFNFSKNINNFIFKSNDVLNGKYIKINEINKLDCTWKPIYQIFLSEKVNYDPGDNIGLITPNSDLLIEKLMKYCEFKNEIIKIEYTGTINFLFIGYLFDFFKYKMDLKSLPKKLQLLNLSKKAKKKNELEYLCSIEGKKDYMNLLVNSNNIIEIIEEFECKPSLDDLIRNCEMIKPRYYSLINKKEENMEILVGIVNKTKGLSKNIKLGHVSEFIEETFIKNLKNQNIEIIFKKNKLTKNLNKNNLICFCTGTGITPFISLYRNLRLEQNISLIYGYRNDEDDLSDIFKLKCKIIKCKSSQKIYVTDFLKEINDNSFIFLCGNMIMQKLMFLKIKEHFYNIILEKKLFFDNWE